MLSRVVRMSTPSASGMRRSSVSAPTRTVTAGPIESSSTAAGAARASAISRAVENAPPTSAAARRAASRSPRAPNAE